MPTSIAQKMLRLYGRNALHHLGALLGALAPIVLQLLTHHLGWREASALSTAVIVAWILGNAHISGKLAGSIATDLSNLIGTPGAASGLMGELEGLLGSFLGGQAGGHAGGVPSGPSGPVPAGLGGLFPSGQPPTATAGVTITDAQLPPTAPVTTDPGPAAGGPA